MDMHRTRIAPLLRCLAAAAFVASVGAGACSQPPAPGAGGVATSASGAPVSAPQAAAPNAAPASVSKSGEMEEEFSIASEKFGDPQKAFGAAKDALLTHYYAAGLTEEDIYRAAVRGMVEDVDVRMHKWNKLLAPSELAELRSDLKGEIVGIGVKIKFDAASGHIDILGTIAGSPAEKAGMQAGDTILSVNSKLFRGKTLREAIQEMRGKAGEVVTLSVLRDDKILPFSIARAPVQFDETRHFLADGVGYLQVWLFSEKTAPAVKAALDDFAAAHARAITLDLRLNSGGSFDDAVKTAELFLPNGTPIVTLERREGQKETMVSKGSPVLGTVPMVLLVDHGTSSGAELLTAALTSGRHARTVGSRTYGKWSVQTIDDLGNGYAIKYTTALFHAPGGESYDGVGLAPDVAVDADKDQIERIFALADPSVRIQSDVQLRTALALLKP
jgi:carboxyl-terminal processing protease